MSVSEQSQDEALLSPTSASGSQSQWPRPRSPIPPHRLAKLANALGIATPVPMNRSSSDSFVAGPSIRSDYARSPTPSTSAASRFTTFSSSQSTPSNFQSKYLLHVIPPHHLPHDTNSEDVLLTPPPSSASGYHKHFRRGTLVPFLPSFQAQLGAIAKEYALPSTTGMIVYLVTGTTTPSPSPSPSPTPEGFEQEEPGPRLSEDIWKHLWLRVVKTEHEDAGYSTRSGTPVGLGLDPLATPSAKTPTPLRPLVTVVKPAAGPLSASSPSTAASESDPEASTPNTSLPPESSRADSLHLPGLNSPSLIPILAKVEFDIDKRKANWYAPWLRSRKQNLIKRAGTDDGEGRLGLKLVNRRAVPRFLLSKEGDEEEGDYEPEYAPRAESPEEEYASDAGDEDEAGRKRRVPPPLTMPPRSAMDGLIPSSEPSPLPSAHSHASDGSRVKLPYRESDDEDGSQDVDEKRRRRRENGGERRTGAYFDDLDLGLEFDDTVEFDDNDPNDRRRSQLVMKERLDELEKNLASLSPRRLKHEDDTSPPGSTSPRSSSLTRSRALSPQTASHGRYLSASSQGSQSNSSDSELPAAKWPAVPYSTLSQENSEELDPEVSVDADDFPAPPKFAINGITTSVPASPYKASFNRDSLDTESAESAARRRAHDEGQDPSYPEVMPPSMRRSDSLPDSPFIPLSPDPFGRFPSEPTPPVPPVPALPGRTSESSGRSSTTLVRSDSLNSVEGARKLSSRFSMDSEDQHVLASKAASTATAAQAPQSGLNPVKSIRTLWRKSRKAPAMADVASRAAALSPAAPMPNAVPMPRVSEEVVTNAMLPPNHASLRPPAGAADAPFMTTAEAARRARESSINAVTFDQESPYPIRRSASTQPPRSPPPSSPTPDSQPNTAVPRPQSTTPEPGASSRKSILKGWGGGGGGRRSLEEKDGAKPAPEGKDTRKRRPSMIDLVRGSRASTATEALPPSPMLPEQYARAGPVLPRSSESSSLSSPPPVATPSAAADDTFEIIDAQEGAGHGKTPRLSYPYHELDHQP